MLTVFLSDVDECRAGTDNCQQQCTNTPGGFTCGCNTGYELLGNGYQCQGEYTHARTHTLKTTGCIYALLAF